MPWNEPGGNKKDPWSSGGKNNDGWNNSGGNGGDKDNNQGPPDLDEALQKVQEKLNAIFNGKGSGGGSGNQPRSGGSGPGGSFTLVGIIAVIALIFWTFMGFYTVNEQERSVVLRLGKFNDVKGAGLRWNPPLIDEITKINVTQIRIHDHNALMLTKDENIVDVGITVQYLAENPQDFLLKVRNPENSLAQATESALRQVIGTTEMNSILTEGRSIIAASVQEQLQRLLDDYETGIRISGVNVRNAQAPNQVQDAFDDVIKAREDEQRVKNEAEAYANTVVPEARGQAQRIFEEAQAYREEVVARSTGESERFLALLTEYRLNPDVMRERLYIEMMQSVLSNNPKILMDIENGGNNLMLLPLDQLLEQGGQRSEGASSRTLGSSSNNLRSFIEPSVSENVRNSQRSAIRESR